MRTNEKGSTREYVRATKETKRKQTRTRRSSPYDRGDCRRGLETAIRNARTA